MTMQRDGSALTDLASYCLEMQAHVRELTQRLKLGLETANGRGTRGGQANSQSPSSKLTRVLRSTSNAFKDLLNIIPSSPVPEGGLDPRVLVLGLLSQWMDRHAELARRAMKGVHGHTDSMSLLSVCEFIAMQKKSGTLKVEAPSETFFLEFDDGDIVHAISNNSPPGERLGEILVQIGAIDEETLMSALKEYQGTRRKLGARLAMAKLVGPDALGKALEIQVQRLFDRIFDSRDSFFEFIDAAVEEQTQKVRIGVMPLLLERARIEDEGTGESLASGTRAAVEETPQQAARVVEPELDTAAVAEDHRRWRGANTHEELAQMFGKPVDELVYGETTMTSFPEPIDPRTLRKSRAERGKDDDDAGERAGWPPPSWKKK